MLKYNLIDLQKIFKKSIDKTRDYTNKFRIVDDYFYYSDGFVLCKLKLKDHYNDGIYSIETLARLGSERQSKDEFTFIPYIGSSIDRLLESDYKNGIMTSHDDFLLLPRYIKAKNSLTAINIFSQKVFIVNQKYPNKETGIRLQNLEIAYSLGLCSLQYYHESSYIVASDNDFCNMFLCSIVNSDYDA